QSPPTLNFLLDQLARILRVARQMRGRRHLHAPPHQFIRHLLADRLRATLLRPGRAPRGRPLTSALHQELPVAPAIHPDPPTVISPRRAFHARCHAYLPRQLYLRSLRIRVAVVLPPVIRHARNPLGLGARPFSGMGRIPRHAHHKFCLTSFIYPYPVLVPAPRRSFFALCAAQLPHQLYPIACVGRARGPPPILRRACDRLSHRRVARLHYLPPAQRELSPTPFIHPDSFLVVAPG